MVKVLARFFIKEEDSPAKKRQSYGMICGMAGIFFNMLLFAGKLLAGRLSNSISITADAFNNLSDAGSSAVTLAGFKRAGTKPDTKHPFGHGRIEYISGLIVSAAILIMAYELIRDSVDKILHPQETQLRLVSVFVLLISIAVKLYMAYYNRSIGKMIDSAAMRAAAADSLSDALATTVVLAAALAGHMTNVHLDGYCGVLVGLFIFYTGISAAKETLNPLLGQQPEASFVEEIYHTVTAHEGILGIHDLIVHDYGPGRQMISLHAEVSARSDLLEIHDLIDRIEAELREKLYCEAVIHMDPVVEDEQTNRMRTYIKHMVHQMGDGFSMHDFRMVPGQTHTNLIFDVVVPFEYEPSDSQIIAKLQQKADLELNGTFFLKIQIDRAYVKYEVNA